MSRMVAVALAAVMALGSLTLATIVSPARTLAGTTDYSFCPPAKNLVTHSTHLRHRTLSPGVRLAKATLGHRKHTLALNVVRVNLHSPQTAVGPLHRAITARHKLSQLANRPRLLAATNGTYFNFTFGAPTVPFIGPGGPVVLSRYPERVAGISVSGRAQDGDVWLAGHATTDTARYRLAAINNVAPPAGLSLYTPQWGRRKVPLPLLGQTLPIRNGQPLGDVGTHRRVPPRGDLLVGTTPDAVGWLDEAQQDGDATVAYHAATDAAHRFQQAYGVGTQVVATKDHVRDGLYCRIDEIYAARTDIAWRHHGRQLILATITSPNGSKSKGVDENQMSQVMVGLGAARSYALDGGGSTELVARLQPHHPLTIQTQRHGAHERPIPLGIGVYSVPVPVHHQHKHKHKHKHKHHPTAPHKKKCLLGALLCH